MKKTFFVTLFCIVVLSACISVNAFTGLLKDPIAAGDVCNLHTVHECDLCTENVSTVSELQIIHSGECPRCRNNVIQNVCSKELKLKEGIIYTECDDPSHPDECEIRETYCYTNNACVDCTKKYFVSGTEVHLESIEHTLTDVREDCCTLPVVHPPKH